MPGTLKTYNFLQIGIIRLLTDIKLSINIFFMKQTENKKIQVSIVMSKETKMKYAKLAVERDMSFSQLVRHALRELETKKDQAATRS